MENLIKFSFQAQKAFPKCINFRNFNALCAVFFYSRLRFKFALAPPPRENEHSYLPLVKYSFGTFGAENLPKTKFFVVH